MARSVSALEDALLQYVFGAPATSPGDTGAGWANAYAEYAKDAQSCALVFPTPASIALGKTAMSSAIASASASAPPYDPVTGVGLSLPPAVAFGIAGAFAAFWAPIIFPGMTAPIGVPPVPPPPLPGLAMSFLTFWGSINTDAAGAASNNAAFIHAWTSGVIVSHAPGCGPSSIL